MKVLVIGGGGREHALAWKLAQSPRVSQIYCAPGNPGTSQVAQNIAIKSDDLEQLMEFARNESIDLTVVGPEAPLVAGLVDEFKKIGLNTFGPCQAAAQLEGSKRFAKEFMAEFNIPTAGFESFDCYDKAMVYLDKHDVPVVIKADGLAAGKGVTVATDRITAQKALVDCFKNNLFGSAGQEVVIEDFLEGEEVSVLAICDGDHYVILPPAQDHKPAFDNDQGPNTGGMGAYAPAPVLSPEMLAAVEKNVIEPVLAGMRQRGTPYQGVLYAGLIVKDNKFKVLEFNCRMGDPETQAVLPILDEDLFDLFYSAAQGQIQTNRHAQTTGQAAVCVVLASGGYPGSYNRGLSISGAEASHDQNNCVVFHAGTTLNPQGELATSGGRVLGVTGLGENIADAIKTAYQRVDTIQFDRMFWRRDIGHKALG